MGAGAAYWASCLKAGRRGRAARRWRRLRALGSTGSPLSPEVYEWGWQQVGRGLWWAVISGGTDLASAFLGGTPELPTVPGEMQARALGADVEAWDEQGRPLEDAVGELVCVQPMPSMPVFFWNDVDGRRYRDSYFDVYPASGGTATGCASRPAAAPSSTAAAMPRSTAMATAWARPRSTAWWKPCPQVLDSLVVDIEYLGRPSFMPLFVVLREGADARRGAAREIRVGASASRCRPASCPTPSNRWPRSRAR
jgi:acetoacetyl-CoA synthetase